MRLRLTANRKYLYYLNHFATPKKLLNILENRKEYKNGNTTLKSYPYKITFDPGNICNLRCPGCHTGIKHPEMLRPAFMKLDNYKTMFDQVKDHALSVALYNWGEPFLNKQIFDIIDYTRSQKVGTTIHSNLNHFNETMADDIVKSGLTHLYLSIDGASQDVYAQYRVKGHLEQVIHNLKLLIAARKKANSKLPFITWKYLVFPFNKHEVEKARSLAKEIGVDNFEVFDAVIKLTDIYDEAENYKQQPELFKTLTNPCKSLWASIYLEPNGTVFPCSLSFRENEGFGNLVQSDFKSVWNNTNYSAARGLFKNPSNTENIPMPCKGCKYFLKCSMSYN